MKNLDDLIKDGFYISEVKSDQDNIADYSLIGALKAYFSTAEDLDWYLSRKSCNILTEKDLKELLVGAYARDACNAIIQLQHFFELFFAGFVTAGIDGRTAPRRGNGGDDIAFFQQRRCFYRKSHGNLRKLLCYIHSNIKENSLQND